MSRRETSCRVAAVSFLEVTDVALSPDGRTVASIGNVAGEHGLTLWNATTLRPRPGHHLTPESINSREGFSEVVFLPDGQRIAVASRYAIYIVDVESRTVLCELRGKQNPEGLTVSPDGELIASIHGEETVALWKWRDAIRFLEPKKTLASHPAGKRKPRLCYSPDGTTVAIQRS